MYNYREDYYNYLNNNYNVPSYNQPKGIELFNPYQGFIRGNMFPDLYNYYKNGKPYVLNPGNEQAELLTNIDSYGFALNDLKLYLDVHPDDRKYISLYNEYVREYQKNIMEYTRKFGNMESNNINESNKWTWVSEPWPWQGDK